MSPTPDPVRQLLAAYCEADTYAAVHLQALRTQQLAWCLCWSGAQLAFRRKFLSFLS